MEKEVYLEEIEEAIANKDISKIKAIIERYDLEIVSGRLVAKNKQSALEEANFWDEQQYIRKILLNSLYGALLNPHMRFFDPKLGGSVTMTGRCITKHMNAKINEIAAGVYDHQGDAIIYGDSVTGDQKIKTTAGEYTFDEFWEKCVTKKKRFGKREYGTTKVKVITIEPSINEFETDFVEVDYVMKHENVKEIYEIETSAGKKIKVTEDHSLIVERDKTGILKIKPSEIKPGDKFITVEYNQN